jgi:hypothetical protein
MFITPNPSQPAGSLALGAAGVLFVAVLVGCASDQKPARQQRQKPLDERQIQSILMSSSDELMYSAAEACAQIIRRTDRADSQQLCTAVRVGIAIAAIEAATSSNPRVGYADLLTLATLQRMAMEEPTARAALDEEDRLLLHRTLATAEERLWSRTVQSLTNREKDELRELIVAWRKANPDRVAVSQLRLQDFADSRLGAAGGDVKQSTNLSVLRLLRLDPMEGLDPATRQLRETSLLVERIAFWAQRMPLVVGWQVELTSARFFNSAAAKGFARNSSQFTDAAGEFAKASDRVATSFAHTLEGLPKERSAAIEQADRALAARLQTTIEQADRALAAHVKSLIDQTATAVASERKAAVEQIGRELSTRMQESVARLGSEADAQARRSLEHAAGLVAAERKQFLEQSEAASRRLVDRMATRLVIVIAAGAIAVVCAALVYRCVRARTRI